MLFGPDLGIALMIILGPIIISIINSKLDKWPRKGRPILNDLSSPFKIFVKNLQKTPQNFVEKRLPNGLTM